jgi:hypothetical protein
VTRQYCTYFDSGYLPRGLALYESLRQHDRDARLWVLALDEGCESFLRAQDLPGMSVVGLATLATFDPEAAATRTERSRVEYYFTLTPVLPLYVLAAVPEADLVTYLDADLFFFGDPQAVFDEIGAASVAIVEHRFPPQLENRLVYGRFNVGWVTFRRDADGLACLRWWRDRCVEWCYDRLEGDRFADQKYLDQWPERFSGVHVVQHHGANVAPWNLAGARVTEREGRVCVEGDPLIFFHFHGLTQLRDRVVDPNLEAYGARANRVLRRRVFRPYVRALQRGAALANVAARSVSSRTGILPDRAPLSPWGQLVRQGCRLWALTTGRRILVAPPRRPVERAAR